MTVGVDQLQLTEQQRIALEAGERSLSLSAGAGCGKTFVLTERFLSLVDPRHVERVVDLQQLAAITFTDAAAREMRQRIRNRCYERLRAANDPSEAAAWQRLMRSIEAARISTIHSFCTNLLREHYVEAGLDPQFQVLDAPAADLLRLEAIDARLQQLLEGGDPRVIDLAVRFGLDGLRQRLTPLAGEAIIRAAERWNRLTPEQLYDVWVEFFRLRVQPAALRELLQEVSIGRLQASADPNRATSEKLRAHLFEIHAVLDAMASLGETGDVAESPALTTDAFQQLRVLARVQGVCTKKDWHHEEDFNAFRDACKDVRDALTASILTRAGDQRDASLEAASVGLQLLDVAAEVSEEVAAWKLARNQLEFDDLLLQTHRLLTDPQHAAVRRQASSALRLLMVDEFQDTDPRQVEIVQALCGDAWNRRGLFVVGDFKQSIYRFRDAEPRVFHELREQLPPEGRLALTANFRSQPAILDFVNGLFHDAFSMPYEPLIATRSQTTPTPAIEFLWSSDLPDDKGAAVPARRRESGRAQRTRRQEATWIARRLRQLVDSGEPVVTHREESSEAARPLQLGDIAILFRSLSDVEVYESALRENGLDYYLAGGHAFYAQQEIFDVLNLLQAVASRIDEISLAGALRSPMFALHDATLFWLFETHGSLNAALASGAARPKQLEQSERAKVQRAETTLRRLRDMKDRAPVAVLLAEAFHLTGYDAIVQAEFLGARKLANLKKLVELARSLDHYSPGDLPRFIRQLAEFVARAPKEPLAATQSQGNVIRIMTIHYAKGLEFPFVVLPDLDRPRHRGPSEPALHSELGPVLPGDRKSKSLGWELYRYLEDREELEERTRLLYVACTRAADYLLLSSHVDDLDKPGSDWLKLIGRKFELATGAPRESLPEGYATPTVRVTTDQPSLQGGRRANRRVHLEQVLSETRQRIDLGGTSAGESAMPLLPDLSRRRRFSFSQLTGQLSLVDESPRSLADGEEEVAVVAPSMEALESQRDDQGVDPRKLGTLVHAVLERINFQQPKNVKDLVELLAPQWFPHQTDVPVATANDIVARFLRSPRAQQLRDAPTKRLEEDFILPWQNENLADGCYLYGLIDCLYQDKNGRWVLLDYKTNRVEAADVPVKAKQYELQLFVYALACEEALQTRLAEIAVYFLRPGVEYRFEWEPEGVERLKAQASEAMLALSRNEQGDQGPPQKRRGRSGSRNPSTAS